jgi:predicted DCC family thiol-disulfide oxidoreductase YuxK
LSDTEPILLYDGVCALCNGTVKLVLRFDRRGTMKFAPLDSPIARSLLSQHPNLGSVDSIVLVVGDRARVRSTAVLEVFRYLGGAWKLFLVGYLIPREIRDSLYDVVAYWRYRMFGRYAACPLPSPEVRGRFLFE